MSNLNKLNEVLFDTLEKVQNGEMDEKRASAVVQLSNSIINNGKLQLSAYKFANSGKAPEMFGLPEPKLNKNVKQLSEKEKLSAKEKSVLDARDRYEGMSKYASELSYDNTSEAMKEIGKEQFKKDYQLWLDK